MLHEVGPRRLALISVVSGSLMPPGQGVGRGEDQDHDAGHQGSVFLREAAHGDLGSQGLEQQTAGSGAQDAAPAALQRDSAHNARGDRIQLIARRGVGLGDAQPGEEEDRGHPRGQAAQDERLDPEPAGLDS